MSRFKGLVWFVPFLFVVALAATLLVAPPAHASGITINPPVGIAGTIFQVTASGLPPLDSVSTWLGRPDGTILWTGNITVNAAGTIEYRITPPSGWPPGDYQVAIKSSSGSTVYNYFTVNGGVAPVTNATVTPRAVPSTGATSTPAPTPATLRPVSTFGGRTFYYSGTHYKPGEPVWVWYTTPDHRTVTFGQVNANIFGSVFMPITLGDDWAFGAYTFAAQGLETRHLTFVVFSYFDRQVSDLIASDPVPGQPMFFEFEAFGFHEWEKVSMWIAGPQGKVYQLPTAAADANGDVIWSTYVQTGLPCGDYRIVAAGLLSYHVYYDDYFYCF